MDHSSRDTQGRFLPGNPGRPPGARSRMSQRVALSLLGHYLRHEADILSRLSRGHFDEYMRLIGRILPGGLDEDGLDLEALAPDEAARTTRAVRAALDRVEAGEASLAEVESALLGVGGAGDPP